MLSAPLLLPGCVSSSEGAPDSVASTEQKTATAFTVASAELARQRDRLIAFRHDLHRYPEVSGNEKETSRKVAQELMDLGWEVRTGVGGYGVVGILRGAGEGPLIAFRADMDAVPSNFPDPAPYASEIEGVRHICGHDMHTAIGVGLAHSFTAIKDRMNGSVMLIFQPSEETGIGARNMLADGIFDEDKPDAIVAVHTAPQNVGTVSAIPNGMMAGRGLVEVELSGKGDLEAAQADYRSALKGVATVSGAAELQPTKTGFIAINLFAPQLDTEKKEARVLAFVMSAGLDRRDLVEETVRAAIAPLEHPDIDAKIGYSQALEGVNNDPDILRATDRGILERADDVNVVPLEGVTPAFSEDFGSFQQVVPGAFYFLGVNNPAAGTIGFPHSPDYVADDAAIEVGARAMLAGMLELMEESRGG